MSLQVKPSEKKRRKTKSSSLTQSLPQSSTPSFSLLPDEITVDILARIPRPYYPRLSIVSKSFRSLLSSTELYVARSHLGSTKQCLYVCLQDPSYQFPQWFMLWVNPNQTLPNSSMINKKKKKIIRQLLVPLPVSDFPSLSKSTIVVGSEIYVIGGPVEKTAPSSAVRILDCRSHTWRDAPNMNIARRHASSCIYDGKIYVMGGLGVLEEFKPWAEVFDTMTQTWECLPDPDTDDIRRSFIHKMKGSEGKIYVSTLEKMYAYDTKQNKWEGCEKPESVVFKRSECLTENVLFSFGEFRCWSQNCYKKVTKGLRLLADKYMRNGGSSGNTTKLVSCSGKLLFIWEGYMKHNPKNQKKIWCAQIVLEERDGDEVWGKVELVDVVHTVPTSCKLLHCLTVSV